MAVGAATKLAKKKHKNDHNKHKDDHTIKPEKEVSKYHYSIDHKSKIHKDHTDSDSDKKSNTSNSDCDSDKHKHPDKHKHSDKHKHPDQKRNSHHNHPTRSSDIPDAITVENFYNLYDELGEDINKILHAFYSQDEDKLETILTDEKYKKFSTTLYNSKIVYNMRDMYNQRIVATTSGSARNDALYECNRLLFGNALKAAQNVIRSVKESKIRIKYLEDQITQLQAPRDPDILTTSASIDVVALVPIEIREYVLRWGVPVNHIYDTDKMVEICNELKAGKLLHHSH